MTSSSSTSNSEDKFVGSVCLEASSRIVNAYRWWWSGTKCHSEQIQNNHTSPAIEATRYEYTNGDRGPTRPGPLMGLDGRINSGRHPIVYGGFITRHPVLLRKHGFFLQKLNKTSRLVCINSTRLGREYNQDSDQKARVGGSQGLFTSFLYRLSSKSFTVKVIILEDERSVTGFAVCK